MDSEAEIVGRRAARQLRVGDVVVTEAGPRRVTDFALSASCKHGKDKCFVVFGPASACGAAESTEVVCSPDDTFVVEEAAPGSRTEFPIHGRGRTGQWVRADGAVAGPRHDRPAPVPTAAGVAPPTGEESLADAA